MHALDLGVIGGPAHAREANLYAQTKQPQMQAGWKGRGRGVVKKDRAAIKREPAWQAGGQKCPAEHQLIGFERWIGGADAGITLDFESADRVDDVNETDLPKIVHRHRPLGVEFPFVVGRSCAWCDWFGQFGVTVVAACEFGVLEVGRNPCATGQRMLSPEWIGAQFGQNRIGSPARMRAAQLKDGITERRNDRAERPGRWSADRRG